MIVYSVFCRVSLSANYIRLKSKNSNWYQYSVSYTPNVDSRGMRYKLLYTHDDVLGPAKVFDGSVLFLPHELPSKVSSYGMLDRASCELSLPRESEG